jgi:multiple sugar transport system substrate-binding protein
MVTRRTLLKGAAVTGAGILSPSLLDWTEAWAQEQPFKPEPGARLTFLRWAKFLDAEDRATRENIAAFTKVTGVEVTVNSEWQDDIQPKAAVAANTGSGPDIVWALHTTPHLFPDKLLDISDVANYIGGKYGGWYPLIEQYGRNNGRWIGISNVVIGVLPIYRPSVIKAAGFEDFPKDTDGFLKLCQAMKAMGKPAGFPFGKAPSDGNAFLHWLLWAHGAKVTDENGRATINSPETLRAIDYARALYAAFIDGTAGWNDATNNQAFIGQNVYMTNNSVSILGKARTDKMPFADDIDHAPWPVGASGAAEFHLVYPLMVFNFTKYPNAAKALLAFMMERPQYEKLLEGSAGYVSQSLKGFESSPLWDRDPKIQRFKDVAARGKPASWPGPLGSAAAAVLADYVVIDMFAEAVTGAASPKDAAAKAEKRVQRHYRA